MKNYILLLCCLFVLSACKKDNETSKEFTSTDLVGTWRVLQEVSTSGNVIDYANRNEFRLQFTSNTMTSIVDGKQVESSSYTIEPSNTIRLNLQNWYTYEYKNEKLYLYRWGSTTSDDGSYWVCDK